MKSHIATSAARAPMRSRHRANAKVIAAAEAAARNSLTGQIDVVNQETGATRRTITRARDATNVAAGTPRVTCDRYTASSQDGALERPNMATWAPKNTNPDTAGLRSVACTAQAYRCCRAPIGNGSFDLPLEQRL